MPTRSLFRLVPGALALALAAACRERAPAPGAIVLRVSARHPSGDPAPATRVPLVYGDSFVAQGPDTIFLRRVRLVLMEMAIAPSVANECEEEEGEDNPPCVDFHEDPFVLEVPLGRGSVRSSAVPAPATGYNLFQSIIHKPDSSKDSALLRANPDLQGASVRVDGVLSHGGKRHHFVFVTPFNEQEEIALEPAVAVPSHDTLHLTLRVDVGSWFTTGDHQSLIDPASAAAGGPNAHTVNDNIRTSLKVFRDTNRDGIEDDHAP